MAISFEPKRPRPGKRAIVYDVTHLTTRLTGVATTGIDWVDRAYARHWAGSERLACGLHYGLLAPHLLSPARVADLSRATRGNSPAPTPRPPISPGGN